jgi:hypothetical protein
MGKYPENILFSSFLAADMSHHNMADFAGKQGFYNLHIRMII